MEQDTFDLRDLAFPEFVYAKRELTYETQTIICRLIVSVLRPNSVFSWFLLMSSSFDSKLSVNPVNPGWVKSLFSKQPKEATLGRELRK